MKTVHVSDIPQENVLTDTLELAQDLMARPSVTPEDHGCQQLIAERLQRLGFNIEHHRFDKVDNLWATFSPQNSLSEEKKKDAQNAKNSHSAQAPLFVFAGHTDVVPPGPLSDWISPPFTPTIRDGYLFGRGAADMKGSIAAMITACERFVKQYQTFSGSIGFLITSDEEGPAVHGTKKVLETLQHQGLHIDYCLVGEPTSEQRLADVIKVGRRGSLSGHLKLYGTQKHIAYASPEDNVIHRSLNVLSALSTEVWDIEHTPPFPKTSFHISNFHAGTHAGNIVPGVIECQFNFRFSPHLMPEQIQKRVEAILDQHEIRYDLRWELFGLPFLTQDGILRQATHQAIHELLSYHPLDSASGGTSDARFIAQTGAEVIELGPIRSTIHAVNECVKIEDLATLSMIYERLLQILFANSIS